MKSPGKFVVIHKSENSGTLWIRSAFSGYVQAAAELVSPNWAAAKEVGYAHAVLA